MAYYSETHGKNDLLHRILARAADMLHRSAERYTMHRNYRVTLRELSALSDHELADLGLVRGQISSIAWASAKGETVR